MGLTILKNMKVNGKDDIPYMKWNIKFMFQTTNQIYIFFSAQHGRVVGTQGQDSEVTK